MLLLYAIANTRARYEAGNKGPVVENACTRSCFTTVHSKTTGPHPTSSFCAHPSLGPTLSSISNCRHLSSIPDIRRRRPLCSCSKSSAFSRSRTRCDTWDGCPIFKRLTGGWAGENAKSFGYNAIDSPASKFDYIASCRARRR